MSKLTEFIGDVPEFEIRDGCMVMANKGVPFLVMPLRTFRLALARSARVVAEHDARGEVVPLRRRSRA